MQNFNPLLLKEITNKELAKLILFCINEQIEIISYISFNGTHIELNENSIDEINKTLKQLIDSDIIQKQKNNYTVNNNYKLYSENKEVKEKINIQLFRNEFKNAFGTIKASNNTDCLYRLDLFVQNYKKHISTDQLVLAAQNYIKDCEQNERFVLDAHNFIYEPSKNYSTLASYLDNPKAIKHESVQQKRVGRSRRSD